MMSVEEVPEAEDESTTSSVYQQDQLPTAEDLKVDRGGEGSCCRQRPRLVLVLVLLLVVVLSVTLLVVSLKVYHQEEEVQALSSMEKLLRDEIALQGGAEFDDPRSYQSKAKNALFQDPTLHQRTEQKLAQRYALLCLYYATNRVPTTVTDRVFGKGTVPQWTDFRHWKYHGAHECDWHGIACDQHGFVASIDLRQNGLTGRIPEELTLLRRRLAQLDLSQNKGLGQGGIPWFLSEFGELRSLSLQGTSFQGSVPASVCGLVQARAILSVYADCDGASFNSTSSSSSSSLTCSCCVNCPWQ